MKNLFQFTLNLILRYIIFTRLKLMNSNLSNIRILSYVVMYKDKTLDYFFQIIEK